MCCRWQLCLSVQPSDWVWCAATQEKIIAISTGWVAFGQCGATMYSALMLTCMQRWVPCIDSPLVAHVNAAYRRWVYDAQHVLSSPAAVKETEVCCTSHCANSHATFSVSFSTAGLCMNASIPRGSCTSYTGACTHTFCRWLQYTVYAVIYQNAASKQSSWLATSAYRPTILSGT